MRLCVAQLLVAMLAGLIFLTLGRGAALSALAGGLLVALGNALLAARVFAGMGAGASLARFLAGMLLKWVTVLGGLFLITVRWHLPPAPAIAGLVLALAVNLITLKTSIKQ
nr:ATP synthase subunit I [Oleiagrimonas sp. C23AA]